MELPQRKIANLFLGILMLAHFHSPAFGQTIFGEELEQFFKEKVSFRGFVENATGLSVSHGSHFFDTSNHFIMNRFTL